VRLSTPDYCAVRDCTEVLAARLSAEDQTVQSMPDCSPTKWHRAHTTWFFETFLLEPAGVAPFDPAYRYLFNSYYDAVGPRHPRAERGVISRPGIDEIATYRRDVDHSVIEHLDRLDPELVAIGLHHEQQHQELLLMDIKHAFSRNVLAPAYGALPWQAPPPLTNRGWLGHGGGLLQIGHAGVGFSFDSERPRHDTYLRPFAIARSPVTVGDWLAFISDGGYRCPELWLSDGWGWVQAGAIDAPLYWRDEHIFGLDGQCDLDPSAAVVHVSYYEADAFARWAGHRLPTEAEWEATASELGGRGHVWEWTASPYSAYPGYRPDSGAVGEYNGKFMVNQMVLRGSSAITPPGHVRATYRNFFPPSARWAYSGLRLARDA
jgi:ergothioneine biosynthesis protein EgtB